MFVIVCHFLSCCVSSCAKLDLLRTQKHTVTHIEIHETYYRKFLHVKYLIIYIICILCLSAFDLPSYVSLCDYVFHSVCHCVHVCVILCVIVCVSLCVCFVCVCSCACVCLFLFVFFAFFRLFGRVFVCVHVCLCVFCLFVFICFCVCVCLLFCYYVIMFLINRICQSFSSIPHSISKFLLLIVNNRLYL